MNKKILIALGISLALNFVFIGFEAGRTLHRPAFPPAPHMPHMRGKPFAEKAPDFHQNNEMRKTFHNVFKKHAKEIKEAMKNVKDTLKKEPFDVEEFKAALQKASDVRRAFDAEVQEKTVETVSNMPPQERKRFAKRFDGKHKEFKHKKPFFKKNECRCAEKRRPCDKHKRQPDAQQMPAEPEAETK